MELLEAGRIGRLLVEQRTERGEVVLMAGEGGRERGRQLRAR